VKGVGRAAIGVGIGLALGVAAGRCDEGLAALPGGRLSRLLRESISLRFPGLTWIFRTSDVRVRFSVVTGGGARDFETKRARRVVSTWLGASIARCAFM